MDRRVSEFRAVCTRYFLCFSVCVRSLLFHRPTARTFLTACYGDPARRRPSPIQPPPAGMSLHPPAPLERRPLVRPPLVVFVSLSLHSLLFSVLALALALAPWPLRSRCRSRSTRSRSGSRSRSTRSCSRSRSRSVASALSLSLSPHLALAPLAVVLALALALWPLRSRCRARSARSCSSSRSRSVSTALALALALAPLALVTGPLRSNLLRFHRSHSPRRTVLYSLLLSSVPLLALL